MKSEDTPANVEATNQFLAVEREFHDDYAKSLDWTAPVTPRLSYEQDDMEDAETCFRQFLGDVRGKVILDVGSGHGNCALALAKEGAIVTGIDLSPKLVEGCQSRARTNGLEVEFKVMNACVLEFPDQSFDAVVAFRTIHHLPDLQAFYLEAHRVLKPGGTMLLQEPQKFNPFVEFGRKFIKNKATDRTETEHPLVPEDLRSIRKIFSKIETREYEFLTSACLAFKMLNWPTIYNLSTALAKPIDRCLRLLPLFRPLYWQVVVQAEKDKA